MTLCFDSVVRAFVGQNQRADALTLIVSLLRLTEESSSSVDFPPLPSPPVRWSRLSSIRHPQPSVQSSQDGIVTWPGHPCYLSHAVPVPERT
ncbi:unnamed protein product [Periconia digitata]|uniref:Uncharacterized protein n=1 Tax=Periconia digitata TaxID=1303443 RepID=A0A9W4XIS4_9PLEO|nr:unnamed protein product [Periconia digitata]